MDSELDKLECLMEKMTKVFMNENQVYSIPNKYKYFREIMCLYAKQHNMIESIILLLRNNMAEEAFILCRSVINNYFLIVYLLNDDDRTRLKEYLAQPLISEKYFLKNLQAVLKKEWFIKIGQEKGKTFNNSNNELKEKIKQIDKDLKSIGIESDKTPLSIRFLAKHGDKTTYEIYSTYYAEASKYEHSDTSVLELYRIETNKNISENIDFKINLGKTDKKLKEEITGIIKLVYGDSFNKILKNIETDNFEFGNYDFKKYFNVIDLSDLILNVVTTCTNEKPEEFLNKLKEIDE